MFGSDYIHATDKRSDPRHFTHVHHRTREDEHPRSVCVGEKPDFLLPALRSVSE